MLLERMVFNILAFSLFVIMFFKIIRRNDTTYLIILTMQALGIAIGFLEIIFYVEINTAVRVITYICSIIIPIIILYIEKRGTNFSEIVNITLAKIALLFNDQKRAKNFLINLVTKYPRSYLGHKMLAEIYEQEGGSRKAIDEYVKVIDIDKKDYETYYKISYLLNGLGRKEEATEMLESLLKKKPEYIKATMLLGDIYCEREMYKETINLYMDSLKYNQDNYELYYNMGIVYTMLNDFKNAKICYQKAATINSMLYKSYYNIGQISLIFNDLDEAEKYFTQSLLAEEVEAEGYYHLSKIYILKGDKENAIRFANIAIELDSTFIKRIEEEPIFIPIKSNINIFDENIEQEDNKKTERKKLTEKEIKAQEHLDNTYNITKKLSNNEIKIKKEKENNYKLNDIYKEIENQ